MLLVLLFVYFAYVKLCPFSLALGARGWLRLVLVALPAKTQISLGAQSFCWFCHEAAHITVYYNELVVNLAFQYSGDISKGASSDGKVGDRKKKSDKFGIVEIKCPFEKRNIPSDAVGNADFGLERVADRQRESCLLLSDSRTDDYFWEDFLGFLGVILWFIPI